jgi:Rrf2 family transcriptional regulator, iron-sulfur cluster assembly transcription factor
MLYSRSAEYAIRALIPLAGLPPGEFALVKNVAADTGIPAHFLAKLLQDLARLGLLKSTKGPHGGFRLNQPPEEISMLRVMEAIDGPGRFDRCLGGSSECNEKIACGMHDGWMVLRSRMMDYLGGTSIADLAKALGEKRRLLARARRRGSQKLAGRV